MWGLGFWGFRVQGLGVWELRALGLMGLGVRV